ncbi:MAG: response regulator transcription factor [Betaproteobacteria bacterium]|nr:response regulator transcription factor [Betaproteobacteria bacterium]
MRILLTEDDPALAELLLRACKQEGYSADWVSDGVAADLALASETYDALVLDLGLPRMDGLEVLKRLRKRGSHLPVMILTAREAIADRVAGLDSGADDYLPKPFAVAELQARLRALVRRRHGGTASACLELGRLRYDTASRQVFIDGKEVEFSSRERETLSCLLHRPGKVVSKQALTTALSSWDAALGSNAIEVYIHRLRRKLETAGIAIRTVRGLGYVIEPSDDRAD